jgi:repressor LexA
MALTKKQKQVFEALSYLMEKGELPTVRELGALVGLRSPATVMKHLRALEREKLITMNGKSRGIRICNEPLGKGIKVVGKIAAGRPIEAVSVEDVPTETSIEASAETSTETDSAGYKIPINPEIFAGSGKLMALCVAGDSMIEAGILDGDYVIIRRQAQVENGEIAAVDINGEVTLKRWQRQRSLGERSLGERPLGRFAMEEEKSSPGSQDSVRLIAENVKFPPIEISAADNKEVRVLGKYVGLVRGNLRLG